MARLVLRASTLALVVAAGVGTGVAVAQPDPAALAVDSQVQYISSVDLLQRNQYLLSQAEGRIDHHKRLVEESRQVVAEAMKDVGKIAREAYRGSAMRDDPTMALIHTMLSEDSISDVVRRDHFQNSLGRKHGSTLSQAQAQLRESEKALAEATADVERLKSEVAEIGRQVEETRTKASRAIEALAPQETGSAVQSIPVQQAVLDEAALKAEESETLDLSSLIGEEVARPGREVSESALAGVGTVISEGQAEVAGPVVAVTDPPAGAPEAEESQPVYPCAAVVSEFWSLDLPETPRGILSVTKQVDPSQVIPGDLVFEFEDGAPHPHGVGVYVGGGHMVSTTLGTVAVEPWRGGVVTRPSLGLIDRQPDDNQPGERLACGDISQRISPASWVLTDPSDDTLAISYTGGVVTSVGEDVVTINHGYGFIGSYAGIEGIEGAGVRPGQKVLPGTPLGQKSDSYAVTLTAGDRVVDPTGWDTHVNPQGHLNGMLPDSVLCEVEGLPGHRLRCDAARGLAMLREGFAAEHEGRPLGITDTYRTYEAQVRLKATKPTLAATPGRSNHGYGLAVDLVQEGFDGPTYNWLWHNAARFGWEHPDWAQESGSLPEPWHWEFGVSRLIPSATAGVTLEESEPTDEDGEDGE